MGCNQDAELGREVGEAGTTTAARQLAPASGVSQRKVESGETSKLALRRLLLVEAIARVTRRVTGIAVVRGGRRSPARSRVSRAARARLWSASSPFYYFRKVEKSNSCVFQTDPPIPGAWVGRPARARFSDESDDWAPLSFETPSGRSVEGATRGPAPNASHRSPWRSPRGPPSRRRLPASSSPSAGTWSAPSRGCARGGIPRARSGLTRPTTALARPAPEQRRARADSRPTALSAPRPSSPPSPERRPFRSHDFPRRLLASPSRGTHRFARLRAPLRARVCRQLGPPRLRRRARGG